MGCEERVVKRDIGRVLLALEQRQEQQLAAERAPKARTPELSNAEKVEAMALLKDPRAFWTASWRTSRRAAWSASETNKLIGYLAATSAARRPMTRWPLSFNRRARPASRR